MSRPVVASLIAACVLCFGPACSSDSGRDPLDGVTPVSADVSGSPIQGLDDEWQQLFDRGDRLFETTFRDSQGLGPVYIQASCGACHRADGRGPSVVTKVVALAGDGKPLTDQSGLPYGATVRPRVAGGGKTPIALPDDETRYLITKRFGPATFGRGYVEAVLDSEIERLEAEQQSGEDGITGRINRVPYASTNSTDPRFHDHHAGDVELIGRFGLKSRIATIDDFTADAFQGDMGLTSPLRPDELPNPDNSDDARSGIDLDENVVNAVAAYVRLLEIPARASITRDAHAAKLFEDVGCGRCHAASLHTRPDYPVPQLADIDAPIYSDLLLHDMGPSFDDGIRDRDAAGSEWRTAPLLGLRHLRNYLHDGRATSVEDAITAHGAEGSEAAIAASRFEKLNPADRKLLLDFVSAL
jgi:CxxC motif-containing protein (DUF1111 family)